MPQEVITDVINKLEKFDKPITDKERTNLNNIIAHLKNRRDFSSEYNSKVFKSWMSVMPNIKGMDYQSYIPWDLNNVQLCSSICWRIFWYVSYILSISMKTFQKESM